MAGPADRSGGGTARVIAPGATIGIVGGGQLGRMLALAAAPLGCKCHIYDPHRRPCAADVSAAFTRGSFDDERALQAWARDCDVVTYEFENLPVAPLERLGDKLRPGVRSLAVAQDRAEEKRFLERCGVRLAPWRAIDAEPDLRDAVSTLGLPIVLKTRRYGYDGKGQAWIRDHDDAAPAWESIGAQPAVAERGIAFDAEFSVVLARGSDGDIAFFDSSRNSHEGGILRRCDIPPGDLVAAQVADACAMARSVADTLGHVGVLTVEFFASADGPLVNEIAPRVHNSGHWTIEGAETSQFEQHVRAILGLPLGSTALRAETIVMDNLIGSDVSRWSQALAQPGAHLHLYGKGEARPGRKMGHVTFLS